MSWFKFVGILTSLTQERLINVLCGEKSNATLMKAFEKTIGSNFVLRSDSVFYIEQYIKDHHANGYLVTSIASHTSCQDFSKVSARKIFRNVGPALYPRGGGPMIGESGRSSSGRRKRGLNGTRSDSHRAIRKSDFMERYTALANDEREVAWKLLCPSDADLITKKGVSVALEEAFLARKNLASSIESTQGVINSLHFIILCAFFSLEILAGIVIFANIDFS